MGKEIEPEVLKDLIVLRGLTPHRVALNLGIEPSNFSRFLKNKSGVLSAQKLAGVVDYIGLTESGRLKPGIHRWSSPSMLSVDQDRIGRITRRLLPGGVIATYIHSDFFSFRYILVLVPNLFSDARIILSIANASVVKDLQGMVTGDKGRPVRLGDFGQGSKWLGGSVSDNQPFDSCVTLPPSQLDRLRQDADLSVEDLDEMLGLSISGDQEWTPERLIAGLEAKGISYGEAARKLGLS